MGYADDGPGGRHILIADPGFSPFNYWCSLEQVASLIVPHAYAFAASAPIAAAPAPAAPPPVVVIPHDPPVAPPAPVEDVATLTAKVDKLSTALALLLKIIERTNPEILRAYLAATKGQSSHAS